MRLGAHLGVLVLETLEERFAQLARIDLGLLRAEPQARVVADVGILVPTQFDQRGNCACVAARSEHARDGEAQLRVLGLSVLEEPFELTVDAEVPDRVDGRRDDVLLLGREHRRDGPSHAHDPGAPLGLVLDVGRQTCADVDAELAITRLPRAEEAFRPIGDRALVVVRVERVHAIPVGIGDAGVVSVAPRELSCLRKELLDAVRDGIGLWEVDALDHLAHFAAIMSEESTLVTAAHFAYVAAHTQGDDDLLTQLKIGAAEAGIPKIWVSPEQASFMRIVLQLIGAKRVLEVGTLAGYSAITMARALPSDGEVVTLELDPMHARFAEEQVAKSDVRGRVRVLVGDARETLADVGAEGSFDAVFVDADKGGYPEYLEHSQRLLRDGGMLMVDNAFAFGELLADNPQDPEVGAVRAFNEQLAADARFESVIVPIGDGLWIGRKR